MNNIAEYIYYWCSRAKQCFSLLFNLPVLHKCWSKKEEKMANCSEPGEYSTACLPPRGFFLIVSNIQHICYDSLYDNSQSSTAAAAKQKGTVYFPYPSVSKPLARQGQAVSLFRLRINSSNQRLKKLNQISLPTKQMNF